MSGMNREHLSLDDALRMLAEIDDSRQAPRNVEESLLKAFRSRRSPLRPALWIAAAAVAAGLGVVALAPGTKALPLAHPAVPGAGEKTIAVRAAAQTPPRARVRRSRPVPQVRDQFMAFPGSEGLEFEYGTVVRVELPRSALRSAGLPMNEDRSAEPVQAEVVVGYDGSPRAIRLLQE